MGAPPSVGSGAGGSALVRRVLLAIDDSVQSLAAARTAAGLAAEWRAAVRVLTVVADHALEEEVEAVASPKAGARRGKAAAGLLGHVVRVIRTAGVPSGSVEAVVRAGEPFRRILEEARSWHADLIVMAASDRRGLRSPYVGSATEHVLEFAECPVLVVPASPP
jgi:nucleotide-binding universal stress UspA family protein